MASYQSADPLVGRGRDVAGSHGQLRDVGERREHRGLELVGHPDPALDQLGPLERLRDVRRERARHGALTLVEGSGPVPQHLDDPEETGGARHRGTRDGANLGAGVVGADLVRTGYGRVGQVAVAHDVAGLGRRQDGGGVGPGLELVGQVQLGDEEAVDPVDEAAHPGLHAGHRTRLADPLRDVEHPARARDLGAQAFLGLVVAQPLPVGVEPGESQPQLVAAVVGQVGEEPELRGSPIPRLGVDRTQGAQDVSVVVGQWHSGVGDHPELADGQVVLHQRLDAGVPDDERFAGGDDVLAERVAQGRGPQFRPGGGEPAHAGEDLLVGVDERDQGDRDPEGLAHPLGIPLHVGVGLPGEAQFAQRLEAIR